MQLKDIHHKKVLLRADLHHADRHAYKIYQILPTILLLLEQGCGVCVMSTMGVAFMSHPDVETAKPVCEKLEEILGIPVKWVEQILGQAISLQKVYFLENPYRDHQ